MKTIDFEKFEVDEEERGVTFACASDAPYLRYEGGKPYFEVLEISEEAVDLTRLNGGASVLFNHDFDRLLGCVDQAFVAGNKIFVRVRFSRNSPEADRIFRDIIDGVVKNVSIGYQILHFEEKKQDGVVTRHVDKWMPYEVSVVSVPADDTVGIRSMEAKKMDEENKDTTTTELEALEDKLDALEDKEEAETAQETVKETAQKAETAVDGETKNEEAAEIKACGEALGVSEEEVDKAISRGMTAKDFKREFRTYNKETEKHMKNEQFKNFLRGGDFQSPFTLRAYEGWTDAALVGTETYPLVKALEKKMGVQGFKSLSGLRQNISLPVQKTRVAITQTATLHDDATEGKPEFESRMLSPKKFTGMVRISKDLLTLCTDDIEAFIIDSLTAEIGYKFESYLLGQVAAAATNTVTYSGLDAFTWADALAFEAKVGGYNLNDLRFVMSPGARSALKGISKDTGSGRFIVEDNQCNGYDVSVSGCAANDNIYFGAWDHLVVGSFGEGLEILVDPYTYGASGDVRIVGTLCADAVVDNLEAFVVGKVA